MISASEFLKWLEVFNVQFGSGTITIPVPMGQGGTGAVLSPIVNRLMYSTAAEMALLPTANSGVLVTGVTGIPSISTTLPSGLTIPGYLPLSGGTLTGTLILSGLPTNDSDAASKQYVDDVAAGLAPAPPVDAASTVDFAATYNNGASGRGATLTATSVGAVTLDGIPTVALRPYLFKNQASGVQNGIYDLTTPGDGLTAAVFTRNIRYDTPEDINNTGIVPVLNGLTQAGQGWYETATVDAIGVDPLVFVRFGSTGTVTSITAGAGLTGGTITGSGTIALDTTLPTGLTILGVIDFSVDDIGINGNTITGLVVDGNINLNTNGTGLFVLNSSTGINAVLDQDDMASNSATAVPTQQSVKAYVDANSGSLAQTYLLMGG